MQSELVVLGSAGGGVVQPGEGKQLFSLCIDRVTEGLTQASRGALDGFVLFKAVNLNLQRAPRSFCKC